MRLGSLGVIGLVVLVLALWLATGHFRHRPKSLEPATVAVSKEPTAEQAQKAAADAFKVEVKTQTAELTDRTVSLSGNTAPSRVIELAAQVEGQVVALPVRKGARVRAGEVIARLDPRDFDTHKSRAEAALAQAQLEYTAATRLRDSGHITIGELAQKFSQLQSAKAALADANFQINHLAITAPASGVVEEQKVEVGNYVRIGDMVVKILVNDPLQVAANVGENDVANIKLGSPATAVVGGETLTGHVSYVAAMADAKTRTFGIEVAVANPGSRLPAGLSAQLTLPVGATKTQRLLAAVLSLADNGVLGVKHVGSDGRAIFTPVTIIKADGDAVWVAGLPDQIQLITQGQGFVKAGEKVNVAPPAAAEPAPAASVEKG